MRPSRWPVVVGIVVGVVCTYVGVTAAVETSKPTVLLRWVVGLNLAHDLILSPLVFGVGYVVHRRRWLAGGLFVSGVVTLVAFPLVRGYGRRPGDPSAFPRDYGRGLLVTLAAVWLLTAVGWALAVARRRRT